MSLHLKLYPVSQYLRTTPQVSLHIKQKHFESSLQATGRNTALIGGCGCRRAHFSYLVPGLNATAPICLQHFSEQQIFQCHQLSKEGESSSHRRCKARSSRPCEAISVHQHGNTALPQTWTWAQNKQELRVCKPCYYKLDSTNWTLKESLEGQLHFKHKTHRVPCNVSCGYSSHTNAIHQRSYWNFALVGGHWKSWLLNSNWKIFKSSVAHSRIFIQDFYFSKTHLVTSTMEMQSLQVLFGHTEIKGTIQKYSKKLDCVGLSPLGTTVSLIWQRTVKDFRKKPVSKLQRLMVTLK